MAHRRQNLDASLHAESWTDAGQSNQDHPTSDGASSFQSSDGIPLDGGNDNVFDRRLFRKTLVFLKPMLYTPNDKLTGDYRTAFVNIVRAVSGLKSNPSAMELINKDIKDTYGHTSKVIPGTLSAYFLGRKGAHGFSGPAECDPKYAGSLNHTDKITCQDRVLIYSEDKFGSIHECNSEHAYIYLAHHDFNGFLASNIQELKQAGITRVTLIHSDESGAYKKIEKLDVDKVPLSSRACQHKHKPHKPGHPHPPSPPSSDDDSFNGWWWIILLIIVLLLIGLAIWWLCCDRRAVVCCKKCNDNPCKCVVAQPAPVAAACGTTC